MALSGHVVIEPRHGLLFEGPYTKPVVSFLKITNPTMKRVLFQIKTTLPQRYLAQPCTGILEAEDTIMILVTLMPFGYDPDEKVEHKFMVQTIIAPAGKINPEALWNEAQADDIIEIKFSNIFENPGHVVHENFSGHVVMEPRHGLLFEGPHTKSIMSFLKIINPTMKRVLFKVKTTLPERYLAQPSTGILEAEETIRIPVTLLPFGYDPDENIEHKFMVQTIIAPAGKINPEALWNEAQADDIIELKFSNIFENPEKNKPVCLKECDIDFGDNPPRCSLNLRLLDDLEKPDFIHKYHTI